MKKKILICVGLLVVAGLFLLFVKPGIVGGVIGGTEIKIPLSEISSQASFYEVDGINFFAVKAVDGSVKTAFDACDICHGARKGYSQQGDVMICNNCGNQYPISGLGTENTLGGGCWPGYLPSKTEGDYLVIRKSDIEKGAYRF